MAKKKAADAEASEGGGKKKMIMIAVVVLVLAAAGYVVMGKGGSKAAAAATPPPPDPGVVVVLSPVTLNLVDGHYLQVGLAVQLQKGAALGDGGENADPAADGAKAVDQAITLFGSRTMPSLVGAGREKAKAQLALLLEKAYPKKVMGVYFTTFVMT